MEVTTDHTWINPVATHGHFGMTPETLRCYDVFAATEEDLALVGRLCYLSFMAGNGVKIRLRRGWKNDNPTQGGDTDG